MHCVIFEIISRKLNLNAHIDAKGITFDELDNQKWLHADILVVDALKEM